MIHTPEPSDSTVTSDCVVLWMLFVVGALPIVNAVVRGGRWGVFPSLGLLMVAIAVYGLVGLAKQKHRSRKESKRR
jgi:hypothetical protein